MNRAPLFVLTLLLALPATLRAGDRPQWGRAWSRNMVSSETSLPESVDPESGKNVKWTARLGTSAYGTPVVAGGKVLIATNNANPRDPRRTGDCGVLACFDAETGAFLWQLLEPKREKPPASDMGRAGLFATPAVEGDRVYLVTNACRAVCLDLDGMADGNDGPFTGEGERWFRPDVRQWPADATEADVLWRVDLVERAGVHPQDGSNGSPVLLDDLVYTPTSNGTDMTQARVPKPDAPAVVALEKATGRLVGRDRFGVGTDIVHGQWSQISMGEVGGRRFLFYGGGDGRVYAFAPLPASGDEAGAAGDGETLPEFRNVWSYDCDRERRTGRESSWEHLGKRRHWVSIIGTPVVHEGRVYVTAGGDPWHGKETSWLDCLDAGGSGDVTETASVWAYEMDAQSIATPAIADGLVYVTDYGGGVHCLDAATGEPRWTHDERDTIYASALVADGKVYVGTKRGRLFVFAAGREKRLLSETRLEGGVYGTAVAANGVLYVATSRRLYAFEKE
jgi:outer membrane protein assembly factor BamB